MARLCGALCIIARSQVDEGYFGAVGYIDIPFIKYLVRPKPLFVDRRRR